MKWNRKDKPKLGDLKRRIHFAIFPVKVNDKWIWWERYIKVYEFKRYHHTEDYVVSTGLIEDAFTTTGLLNERTVSKVSAYDSWRFHSREEIN